MYLNLLIHNACGCMCSDYTLIDGEGFCKNHSLLRTRKPHSVVEQSHRGANF